ncbi:BPL-N domain-containing protein [Rhodococcus sp. IEGM 1379]|uniref:BPL-N domain-containing protein n=1 Tax=Rhodococcus sp. IEGM 1379 TaxID=3047086 RepID=UPI0024B76922|nr:BPL-N domain-containing protein [Rhodococcus sp. IEGM 1379]
MPDDAERKEMLNRRTFLISATALVTIGGTVAASADSTRIRSRSALVYRGPASSPGCPEAVARLLESAPDPYDVTFCGPDEDVPLSARTLASASLYAQPGGGDLLSAWVHMEQYAEPIRGWVRTGGHYLGFCLGGYLAGATPSFGLLPGDTARYISSRGSDIDTTENSIVEVSWRGEPRSMFFQDGPIFVLRDDAPVEVLARYRNGKVAAVVTEFGLGRVGVVGPHPEADRSWYTRGLSNPDGIRSDLGHDLIETVTLVPQQ